ncbi:MAG TPA: hypothetical protein VMV81_11950 [Phycisphaerae bacterium]|nr:hypothetical protein [Phycisphaerae bacterium]
MVLLSIDRGRFQMRIDPAKKAEQIFSKFKITWPNVWLPDGWNYAQKRFNSSLYGLTLVDERGIVRGIRVRPQEIKRLLGKAPVTDSKSQE